MTHSHQGFRLTLFGAACALFPLAATTTTLPTGGGLLHSGLQETYFSDAIVGDIPPTRGVILADTVLAATNWGENYPSSSTDPKRNGVLDVDAAGWPTEDFSFIFRPTDVNLHAGTYLLNFKGSARLAIGVGGGTFFSADGSVSCGTQTQATQGYNAGTNTTSLRFVIADNGRDAFWPRFTDTNRDGPGGAAGLNSGVTDIRIMCPTSRMTTTSSTSTTPTAAPAACAKPATASWN